MYVFNLILLANERDSPGQPKRPLRVATAVRYNCYVQLVATKRDWMRVPNLKFWSPRQRGGWKHRAVWSEELSRGLLGDATYFVCGAVAFLNEIDPPPHNSYHLRNTVKLIRRSSSIPSPGKMCPTVIDKSRPIGSVVSRLRDQIYEVAEVVNYNCYTHSIFGLESLNMRKPTAVLPTERYTANRTAV